MKTYDEHVTEMCPTYPNYPSEYDTNLLKCKNNVSTLEKNMTILRNNI